MRRSSPVKRPVRVAELLRETLATILLTKCADPRLRELTLTEVEMTPDLKQARVYYVVRESADRRQVLAALHKAMGFIRGEVAKAHILRTMPEFHFLPDEALDRAARLEALFQELDKGEAGKD
ncbi:MAG: 30S ribosome-binding factor RbfA [Syntrophobacterales bacterium]|nr:30S ribosome-binding factor RbfA [Syntrophobacterales bacterium]